MGRKKNMRKPCACFCRWVACYPFLCTNFFLHKHHYMSTFVLSDTNTLNSYGFRVRTAGIGLARFRNNPVMLDGHWNSTASVLGRWENIRVEGEQLKADDVFDEADPAAAKIKGKVDRGFLKGVSIGVTFKRDDMQLQPDGSYLLTKCELLEASIVAVPSNANAVRLYAADTMQLMTDEQVKLCLVREEANQGQHELKNQPNNKMSKIVLSLVALTALGLSNTEDDAQLATGIENLVCERDSLKVKLKEHIDKAMADAEARAKGLVAQAVTDGKFTAAEAGEYETLAMGNYDLAAKIIGKMPGKASLAAALVKTGQPVGEVKNMDDFEKLSLEKQLAFKNENPEGYAALFA